tara:strand:+ start:14628 stop:14915 length:288 start_codon:yes stop_codon:yes gene_type:complete
MTDYIVAIILPFKRKITYKVLDKKEDVERFLDKKRNFIHDYVVIKRDIDNEGNEEITLEKNGYERVYWVVNKIFVLFSIILLLLFSYLYYKVFKK